MDKKAVFFRIINATLCCIGFAIFSIFIHANFPLRLVSFIGLTLPAFIMSRQIQSFSDLKMFFGETHFSNRTLFSLLVALLLGISFATQYRYHIGMPLFFTSITSFALVAASIGAMEEIIFRGFMQGYVKGVHVAFSIAFGSFSHTVYKCCLFMSPFVTVKVDIFFLMFWTFLFGLLSGILKHYSKSVIPSLIAHSLFDILVYGQCISAPWWVW